jgi:excisionase family DNA binding protein
LEWLRGQFGSSHNYPKREDLIMNLMTIKELADYLNVSTRTIHNYMKAGMPKFQAIKGGKISFLLEDIKKWMKRYD